MCWRSIKTESPSNDAPDFFALSDTGIAFVWFNPKNGARWSIMHLPGRGVTIADHLAVQFHSWCPVREFHDATNRATHPEYYGAT